MVSLLFLCDYGSIEMNSSHQSCNENIETASPFGQRTRRGRCPIEQRGEFSVRPSVRTNERTSERTSVRTSPEGPAPPGPQPLGPLQAPAPRPLETLPRPQPPCSRPPASPFQAHLPLESPCPPRTDGKFTPLFYRTSSPSGPLPCLNFSILKKTAQGQ